MIMTEKVIKGKVLYLQKRISAKKCLSTDPFFLITDLKMNERKKKNYSDSPNV